MSDIGSDGVLAGVKERSPIQKLGMHGLVFLIIFGGWEVGARLGYVNELILPAPTSIAYRLYEMFFVIIQLNPKPTHLIYQAILRK